MVEKADAPRLIHRFCGWLLDIMIQRGEKQRGTHRAICVERFGKVRGELLAKSSDAMSEQTCEQIVRFLRRCNPAQVRQEYLPDIPERLAYVPRHHKYVAEIVPHLSARRVLAENAERRPAFPVRAWTRQAWVLQGS